ncbi:MAG: iron chelate uptake ABC transporter family permease subunit, partial [Armatimonadota bacterium]
MAEADDAIPARVGRALLARVGIVSLALAALLVATMCSACVLGRYGPAPVPALQIVARALPVLAAHAPADLSPDETIILHFRLPRVLLGALVGALLAVAGTGLQGLLKNPLADPYIIGVSSGAAVGAAAAMTLGLGAIAHGWGVPLLAFGTGLATVAFVYSLAQQGGRVPVESFLLAGVVVGAFMWAAVFFFMTVTAKERETLDIVFWLMGNLQRGEPWRAVAMVVPFAVVGPGLMYLF